MPTLNPNLRTFWTTKARNKILYGGRASSKTWDAAGFSVFLADNYNLRILCTRQHQNKIEESVYTTIKKQIERFNLHHRFEILKNKIINVHTGSEFIFYGISRNIDEIKSLEGIDILWIEEAHGLTEQQWEILEPTIRNENSECWIIFNPKYATDFVYQRFIVKMPKNTIKRQINYDENPFLSDTMKSLIKDAKEEDFESYRHVYLGEPLANDENVVIRLEWIEAAIDAHKKLGFHHFGEKVVSFDAADEGYDAKSLCFRHGVIIDDITQWKKGDIADATIKAFDDATEYDAEGFVYDNIGLGAGAVKMHLTKADYSQQLSITGFTASETPDYPDAIYQYTNNSNGVARHDNKTNKETFKNKRAQYYVLLADRFYRTYLSVTRGEFFDPKELISLSSLIKDLDALKLELASVKRKHIYTSDTKIQLISKEEMRKLGIKSPNMADTLMFSFANKQTRKPKIVKIPKGASW